MCQLNISFSPTKDTVGGKYQIEFTQRCQSSSFLKHILKAIEQQNDIRVACIRLPPTHVTSTVKCLTLAKVKGDKLHGRSERQGPREKEAGRNQWKRSGQRSSEWLRQERRERGG